MNAFAQYLIAIKKELDCGVATKNTYRPALKALLEACGDGITATNEPKRTLCGAPDFNITRKNVLLGYIETKDIGTNLEEMEHGKGPHGKQCIRYLDGLPNWILTDYFEFRWFVNGKKRLTARIAELDAKGKVKPTQDGEQKLSQLLNAFFREPALTVATAKDLATSMAHMTRIVRSQIIESLKQEAEETERRLVREKAAGYGPGPSTHGPWLHNWFAAFCETLIPDLNEAQFADMFAQTLAYGLFAARVHAPPDEDFNRKSAAYSLPKTNPFLRKLFSEIAGVDMPDSIAWAVDDIVELLKHADMFEILKDFGKGKGKEDPVVHFYETFLAAYDPKMRELRGVYYTPEPVVSYIVRSIDYLLKTRFNRPKGLADENTLILDPATGTATFLYFVIDHIHQSFARQKGAWDDYVEQHLLNRIFGFELLMAPYAVAHLKLGMQLEQTGYKFGSDQRLGIYLTNTLEEAAKKSEQLFTGWVAEEANAAAKIKNDLPIMVVLGNPPYSGISANSGKWIEELMQDYKVTVREEERQIQRLSNDYVKFIRFAQWRLEKTGQGILGFITDNGYLNGILFRDMRQCLMEWFSHIYILNLHGVAIRGAAKKAEQDENVFDITQGVAIALFVKNPNGESPAKVFYADLKGTRENKYEILMKSALDKTNWTLLSPKAPQWYFVPTLSDPEYESWPYFLEIIGTGKPKHDRDRRYGTGIKTRHDSFVIGWSPEDAVNLVQRIANRSERDEQLIEELGLCTTAHFDIKRARERAGAKDLADQVRPIAYRPFDTRYIVYLREFVCEPKAETMRHLLQPQNVAMAVLRRDRRELCAGYFVARGLLAKDIVSNLDDALIWPIYEYPTKPKDELSLHVDKAGRPNLSPVFLKALAEKLKLPQEEPHGLPKGITPEDIFHYTYAVFHSPTYRTRYAEFLKIDFPRLPLTSSLKLFRALAAKGAELVALHLLESPKLHNFITEFPQKGDNVVEKVQYTDEDKHVWINKCQYFGGVPKEVLEFHIGGYQVCEKWLKDRKGRKLSYDDIQHYQKIVVALNNTIRLMAEIDAMIPSWPIT
jgi:predicted helicase